MEKINIRVVFKNNDILTEENYIATRKDNKITYQESEYKVTLTIGDVIKLQRENDEVIIFMEFSKNSNTKGRCFLKKEKTSIDLDIFTDYIITEDVIIIKYKVLTTDQEVMYKLEVLE